MQTGLNSFQHKPARRLRTLVRDGVVNVYSWCRRHGGRRGVAHAARLRTGSPTCDPHQQCRREWSEFFAGRLIIERTMAARTGWRARVHFSVGNTLPRPSA